MSYLHKDKKPLKFFSPPFRYTVARILQQYNYKAGIQLVYRPGALFMLFFLQNTKYSD